MATQADQPPISGALRPNLFIVGAAKCGTTSMHEYLDQHPGIFMAPWKEPHFFCPDLNGREDWAISNFVQYLELFREATDEVYAGESSVGYLFSEEAPRRIKEFCPEARIIIMLREPVDAICSMFHQHVVQGNESIFDLEEALDAEPRRRRGDVPKFLPFKFWLLYTETASYSRQVKRYFDTFGRDAVHVILFDDLKANPRKVYDELIEWLGLPRFPDVNLDVRNQAGSPRNYFLKRLLLRMPAVTTILYPYLSLDLRKKVGAILDKLDPFGSPVPRITDETKRKLAARMQSEVGALERLLDRPLPGWRYPQPNEAARAKKRVPPETI